MKTGREHSLYLELFGAPHEKSIAAVHHGIAEGQWSALRFVTHKKSSLSLHTSGLRREAKSRRFFDVGMNNGDDSAYYLSKGCKVIAVEANPLLVQRARERFSAEIASGQMVIEHLGIWDRPGKIKSWINEERDVFSSFDRGRASRERMKYHSVDVECIRFDALLRKHGVPYYLKLDVEGAEPYCHTSLQSSELPEYVSVEAESLEYLLLLWQMGYRQFKIVDQMHHNSRFPDFTNENLFLRLAKRVSGYSDRFKNRVFKVAFPRGCSGPFAENTPGSWQTVEEVAYNWLHLYFGHSKRGSLNANSWYDFHAKASSPTARNEFLISELRAGA